MNWLNRLLHKPSSEHFSSKLNASLGFWPIKTTLYKQAFSHSSIDQPKYGNNERLEFLGDSILGNVITEYLFHNLPSKNEGVLTDIRSKMVSRRTLNKLAKKFNIEEFVETNLNGKIPASILGNTFEALIAAIYLDKGEIFCKKFIIQEIILKHFSLEQLEKEISSYKKHFIHWTQKNSKEFFFKLLDESGESHKKNFEIAIVLEGETIAKAKSSSKKKAEEEASRIACESLNI
jgi:ribonuclease-3